MITFNSKKILLFFSIIISLHLFVKDSLAVNSKKANSRTVNDNEPNLKQKENKSLITKPHRIKAAKKTVFSLLDKTSFVNPLAILAAIFTIFIGIGFIALGIYVYSIALIVFGIFLILSGFSVFIFGLMGGSNSVFLNQLLL